jgi:glycosyltransferase involved in cell wall biosynthesis
MKTLVMITETFPLGNSETSFLQEEILLLAEKFDSITILPRSKNDKPYTAQLPENVSVNDCLISTQVSSFKTLYYWVLNAPFLYLWSLFQGPSIKYLKYPHKHLKFLIHEMRYYLLLKKYLKKETGVVSIYNYWMTSSNVAVSLLRRRKLVACAVSRAHGGDLYDERWKVGTVPYRDFVVNSYDRIYLISNTGLEYLREKSHSREYKKFALSYLGVPSRSMGSMTSKKEGEPSLIVSVATLKGLKRINLIPDILMKLNIPVRWVHFGDGEMRSEVEARCRDLPENISWELAGEVSNEEILQFYQENNVSALLSLSTTEGLPVSMMEAISCGVPIVATDVGGVHEIVNETTGILFNINTDIDIIAILVQKAIAADFDRHKIVDFYKMNFNSGDNYLSFATTLASLNDEEPVQMR